MKKTLFIISLLAAAPALALADASSTFQLPTDFNANIWSQAGQILTALGPYTEMIIGVILATVVLEIIIGALKK
jgi:nucleoside-specific outer membrane channel protein Tsx